jgi:integrase
MASVSTSRSGERRIKFYDEQGRPKSIWVGKVNRKTADRLCQDIEELLTARRMGQPVDARTAENLSGLSLRYRRKLERAGLLAPLNTGPDRAVLGAFLKAYVAGRGDLKPSTLDNYQHTISALNEYFGPDKPLCDITAGDADEFRNWLQTRRKRPLAQNTARRLCGRAKQFFGHALKKKILSENPFAGMRGLTVRANDERRRFITPETTSRLLNACPSVDWRVLVALCRWGGLRVSEACDLRWEHVLWDRNRILVHCEKTKHHEGREWREVPLFPELKEHLEEAWELTPEGAEMVVGRYRSNQNLGPVLKKIIKRAGLEVWPKPFQNLRSTRETELARQHPIHVVCKWIGNSSKVAMEHYLQVTDDDFQRATAHMTASASRPLNGPKRSGIDPKTDPAPAGTARQERKGAISSKVATVENAGPDAGCASGARSAAPCRNSQSSPSRIRTSAFSSGKSKVLQRTGPKTDPIGSEGLAAESADGQMLELARRLASLDPEVVAGLLRCLKPASLRLGSE